MKQFCILAIAGTLAATAAPAAQVIQNGTFDDTSDWTLETGGFVAQNGSGSFPDLDTANYYWGGNTAFSQISQNYVLTAAEAAAAAAGDLLYTLSADLFGFRTQNDNSTIEIVFQMGMTALGSISLTSLTNDPGTWAESNIAGTAPVFQSTSGVVNAGTDNIQIFVSSTRASGSSNDGYLDNASLVLEIDDSTTAPIPLPAGAPLLLAGLGGLAWLRRRKG